MVTNRRWPHKQGLIRSFDLLVSVADGTAPLMRRKLAVEPEIGWEPTTYI